MPDRMEQLAVDLADLHYLSTAQLPRVAEHFAWASNFLADFSNRNLDFASPNGWVTAPVEQFSELWTLLQDTLGRNYYQLYEVSQALRAVFDDIRTSDDLTADELRRLREELDGPEGQIARGRNAEEHQAPPSQHRPELSPPEGDAAGRHRYELPQLRTQT